MLCTSRFFKLKTLWWEMKVKLDLRQIVWIARSCFKIQNDVSENRNFQDETKNCGYTSSSGNHTTCMYTPKISQKYWNLLLNWAFCTIQWIFCQFPLCCFFGPFWQYKNGKNWNSMQKTQLNFWLYLETIDPPDLLLRWENQFIMRFAVSQSFLDMEKCTILV